MHTLIQIMIYRREDYREYIFTRCSIQFLIMAVIPPKRHSCKTMTAFEFRQNYPSCSDFDVPLLGTSLFTNHKDYHRGALRNRNFLENSGAVKAALSKFNTHAKKVREFW